MRDSNGNIVVVGDNVSLVLSSILQKRLKVSQHQTAVITSRGGGANALTDSLYQAYIVSNTGKFEFWVNCDTLTKIDVVEAVLDEMGL